MGRVSRWICAGAFGLALALTGCHGRSSDTEAVATAPPPGPALTDAYLTDDRDNDVAKTKFAPNAEPIYFVFAALRVNHVPIKAVWFADGTDANQPASLAEEEVTAAGTDYNGAFSHRPPPAGWRPGNYHVDIYFGTQLIHEEHFQVTNPMTALSQSVNMEDMGTPEPTMPPTGVLSPDVTPIPSGAPSVVAVPPMDGIPHDAMGNPMISLSDGFMLHTSPTCTDVQFLLEVNDARQGIYQNPDMTSDISLAFHPGLNTIRLSWDAPNPDRDCRMAIAIKRNHVMRTLTQIHVLSGTAPTGAYALQVRVQ